MTLSTGNRGRHMISRICSCLIHEVIQGSFAVDLYPSIMKTCPCNVYPLEPHFYIMQLGHAGLYLFFLFLLQNIDCGYSLKQPRRGGSSMYLQSMF